jgi:hypothetical protein
MAGDDLVLDLVVRGLRENAAGDELVLGGVGTTIDDALCVGVAYPVEGLKLVSCGGVDVERGCGSSSGGGRFCGLGNGRCCGQGWNCGKQERSGEKLVTKTEHRRSPLTVCFTAEEYESTQDASSRSVLCTLRVERSPLRLGRLTSPSPDATLKLL